MDGIKESINNSEMQNEAANTNKEVDQDQDQDGTNVPDATSSSTSYPTEEPERRFVDGKWMCEDGFGGFLVYENNEWIKVANEDLEDLRGKWSAATETSSSNQHNKSINPYECVVDGIRMEWNEISKQWLPAVEVDEDFLANYHANYGINYDFSQMEGPSSAKHSAESEAEQQKADAAAKSKLEDRNKPQEEGWVELDDSKNTTVYVTNLPKTITEEVFTELMSKCGVIQRDARTNKLKVKIYRDENGEPKGDARCGYIKLESVDLALQILDGWNVEGNIIHVEKAKFQMKGEFDPTKKRRKLTAAQKKRYIENQQKIFDWRPEKPRNYRPISDCTVVMKNVFTMQQMMTNATLLMDLQDQMRTACERFGVVKKVVVHDNNPDGVVCVTFETVEQSDLAVRSLNGRLLDGRILEVSIWDGKTKYTVVETEEQREHRLALWQKYIDEGGEEPTI